MENSTLYTTDISTCVDCNSGNTTQQPPKSCYPWVAEEFVGRNYTLDDVNEVVLKRNIPGIVFVAIIMALGLIGNGHVLFVFSKRKYKSNFIQDRIHANYRIFILWLSILSVAECAVVSPLLIVYLLHPVNYPSDVLCRIFRFLLYLLPVTISLTLVAIAVDRYLVICRTFENKLTSKHSKLMCFATIVVSLILSWPAAIVFGNGKTETGIPDLTGYRCYLGDESIIKLQQYYQTLLVFFFFVVLLVLFILYTKVRKDYKKLLRFRRTSRRYSKSTPEATKHKQAKQESQRVWIYASVTIGYIITSLPYHILAILFFAKVVEDCDMSFTQAQVFYVFIWSYFCVPVINPIIYGFQDDGFRYSVQALYKHSKDSFKKRLFSRKDSDDHVPNGVVNHDLTTQNDSRIVTEITDDVFSNGTDKPRSMAYTETGDRKSELKEIITSIAAISVSVNERIIQEDVNKNSVHV